MAQNYTFCLFMLALYLMLWGTCYTHNYTSIISRSLLDVTTTAVTMCGGKKRKEKVRYHTSGKTTNHNNRVHYCHWPSNATICDRLSKNQSYRPLQQVWFFTSMYINKLPNFTFKHLSGLLFAACFSLTLRVVLRVNGSLASLWIPVAAGLCGVE